MAAAGKAKAIFTDVDKGYMELATTFQGKGAAVFVGILRSSGVYKPKAERSKSEANKSITMAQIGAIHEFGSKDGKIPQRSWLGAAVDSNSKAIQDFIEKLIVRILERKDVEKTALGKLGALVQKLAKARIRKGIPPALAASTLKHKGPTKTTPLIDTGQLINSISFEVRRI